MSQHRRTTAQRVASILEHFKEKCPLAYQLAMRASLAAWIEPRLWRCLRLEVTPPLDVSAEADLWTSPLVDMRHPNGIILHPEMATPLREQLLREHPDTFHLCRKIIVKEHEKLVETIQLQEDLIYYGTLEKSKEGACPEKVNEVFASTFKTIDDGDEWERVADWAWRTLPHLPKTVRHSPFFWPILSLSSARLDRLSPLSPPPPGKLDGRAQSLLVQVADKLKRKQVTIGATWQDGTWRFSRPQDPEQSQYHFTIVDVDPLVLHFFWQDDASGEQRQESWSMDLRQKAQSFALHCGEAVLRLQDGLGRTSQLDPLPQTLMTVQTVCSPNDPAADRIAETIEGIIRRSTLPMRFRVQRHTLPGGRLDLPTIIIAPTLTQGAIYRAMLLGIDAQPLLLVTDDPPAFPHPPATLSPQQLPSPDDTTDKNPLRQFLLRLTKGEADTRRPHIPCPTWQSPFASVPVTLAPDLIEITHPPACFPFPRPDPWPAVLDAVTEPPDFHQATARSGSAEEALFHLAQHSQWRRLLDAKRPTPHAWLYDFTRKAPLDALVFRRSASQALVLYGEIDHEPPNWLTSHRDPSLTLGEQPFTLPFSSPMESLEER